MAIRRSILDLSALQVLHINVDAIWMMDVSSSADVPMMIALAHLHPACQLHRDRKPFCSSNVIKAATRKQNCQGSKGDVECKEMGDAIMEL